MQRILRRLMTVHRIESGFSLLELMVAVVIVAIMIGLITPQLMGASKEATSTACQGNTKTITAALAEYDLVHQALPTGDSQAQLQALVTDGLLGSDALSGNYAINDTDANNIIVSCATGVSNGS